MSESPAGEGMLNAFTFGAWTLSFCTDSKVGGVGILAENPQGDRVVLGRTGVVHVHRRGGP